MIVPIVVGFIVLVLVLGAVGYVVQIYNQLVNLKKQTEQAWSNIDVLLKQRSDELPKIIDTVEQYMDYEQETLQQVIEARSKAQQASNPEQQLQDRISSIEEQISDRRELYNEATTNYNTLMNQVPYVFVANQMNLSERKLYEVEQADREDIDVGGAFGDNQNKQRTTQNR